MRPLRCPVGGSIGRHAWIGDGSRAIRIARRVVRRSCGREDRDGWDGSRVRVGCVGEGLVEQPSRAGGGSKRQGACWCRTRCPANGPSRSRPWSPGCLVRRAAGLAPGTESAMAPSRGGRTDSLFGLARRGRPGVGAYSPHTLNRTRSASPRRGRGWPLGSVAAGRSARAAPCGHRARSMSAPQGQHEHRHGLEQCAACTAGWARRRRG